MHLAPSSSVAMVRSGAVAKSAMVGAPVFKITRSLSDIRSKNCVPLVSFLLLQSVVWALKSPTSRKLWVSIRSRSFVYFSFDLEFGSAEGGGS